MVEEPRKEWELRMEIAAAPRAGRGRRHAARRRGAARRFTLGPVDLQIDWADRVAITGANGSGKSTLLGALLGRVPLDAGHAPARPRASWSARSTRRASCFHGAEPLLDAFGAAVPDMAPAEVRTLLAKFGLNGRPRAAPGARRCRPGERTRAALALLQAPRASTCSSSTSRPTTSTCRPSSSWSRRSTPTTGTLLLVTHDRRMLDAVTRTRRLEVADGKLTELARGCAGLAVGAGRWGLVAQFPGPLTGPAPLRPQSRRWAAPVTPRRHPGNAGLRDPPAVSVEGALMTRAPGISTHLRLGSARPALRAPPPSHCSPARAPPAETPRLTAHPPCPCSAAERPPRC